ncbi:MAG: SRPBCC family protein [Pseudomonadota bacterium]
MQIQLSIDIDATPEQVYAVGMDIERWPKVVSAITNTEILSEGPVGVGTVFRETRIMFGREASEVMTIDTLEPPHRYLFTAENHGTAYVTDHIVEALADGRSRLSVIFTGTAKTILAHLFMPLGLLLAGSLKKQLMGDLEDLKREIESRNSEG